MIRSKLVLSFAIAGLAFHAVSCSSKRPAPTSVASNKPDYNTERDRIEKMPEVAPGFSIDTRHSADEEIAGKYTVDFNGMLKLPYKVDVKAAGLTIEELRTKITKAYSNYFESNNVVSAEIVKKEYLVEVRGLVNKPGRYTVSVDTSLEEISTMAGGFQGGTTGAEGGKGSKPEFLRISRPNYKGGKTTSVHWVRLNDYFTKYEADPDLLWRGGEQLFFQMAADSEAKTQSQLIQITGEVRSPGDYTITPGASLYVYITKAGGPTPTADLNEVTVIRKHDNTSKTYDATDDDKTELYPGDVILVRSVSAKATGFERALPIILAVTSIATSLFLIFFMF